MVAIGALFAALSVSLSRFIGVVLPIADLLLIGLGKPARAPGVASSSLALHLGR